MLQSFLTVGQQILTLYLLLVVGLVASSELLSTLISPLRIFSRTVLYSSMVKVLKFQLASSVGRPT